MEAIILSSRSISHNHCFQKEKEDQYRRHLESIKSINQQRHFNLKEMAEEVDHASSLLKKSKSAAKVFKEKLEKEHLRNENITLIKKLMTIPHQVETHKDDKYQYVSGSHWTYHQKRQAEIREENYRMVRKAVIKRLEERDYKEKMKEEIKEYQKLRDSIRRMNKKGKMQRSHSDMKLSSRKKSVPPSNPQVQPPRLLPALSTSQ